MDNWLDGMQGVRAVLNEYADWLNAATPMYTANLFTRCGGGAERGLNPAYVMVSRVGLREWTEFLTLYPHNNPPGICVSVCNGTYTVATDAANLKTVLDELRQYTPEMIIKGQVPYFQTTPMDKAVF